MQLNNKYFEQLYVEKHNGYSYYVIKPLDSPMILFSKKDGTPLASLHLRCQDNNHQNDYQNDYHKDKGSALITKRPNNSKFKCDFQGLINKDDQEFELVISNLTNFGNINFNILKKNVNIDEVNPGGLNEINELRGYESYAVKCDQSNNGILILSSIKKQDKKTKKEVKVTVKEDESSGSKPTGTYYFLSIVPQFGKTELIELFKETVWKCVDMFCIKKKIEQVQHRRNNFLTWGFGGINHATNLIDNTPTRPFTYQIDNRLHNTLRSPTRPIINQIGNSNTSMSDFNWDENNSGPNLSSILKYNIPTHNSKNKDIDHSFDWDENDQNDSNVSFFGGNVNNNNNLNNNNNNNKNDDNMSDFTGADMTDLTDWDIIEDESYCNNNVGNNLNDNSQMGKFFKAKSMGPLGTLGTHRSLEPEDLFGVDKYLPQEVNDDWFGVQPEPISVKNRHLIENSFASTVSTGRTMVVNSSESGLGYNYDTPSVPCVIGLSIYEKLNFRTGPKKEDLIKLGKVHIKDIVENASKVLLSELEKIYISSSCAICLEGIEDNNPLNSVLYQCGHQCCHYECGSKLEKCPLCRKHITANIKI